MINIIEKISDEVAYLIIKTINNKIYKIKISPKSIDLIQKYNWRVKKHSNNSFSIINNQKENLKKILCNNNKAEIKHKNNDKYDFRIDNLYINKEKYNKYEIINNKVILYTYKNEPIIIDLNDFDKIKNYTWSLNSNGYVVCSIKGKKVYLHRFIINHYYDINTFDIDHRNHNKQDNTKNNLRIVTTSENMMNKYMQNNNTSNIIGVSYNKKANKWVVNINAYNNYYYIGLYDDIVEAKEARIKATEELHKEYSLTNSLKECY